MFKGANCLVCISRTNEQRCWPRAKRTLKRRTRILLPHTHCLDITCNKQIYYTPAIGYYKSFVISLCHTPTQNDNREKWYITEPLKQARWYQCILFFKAGEGQTKVKHRFSEPWEDSDLILVVEDEKFHVHRLILSMNSPAFKAMFKSQFKEATSEEIPLPAKKASEVLDLLKLIYFKHVIQEPVEITSKIFSFFSTKFVAGRLSSEAQSLTLLYTIFDRKGIPFVYLILKNGTL